MKNLGLSIAMVLVGLSSAMADVSPMKVVEKSSYQLKSLVNKKQIDASYLNSITAVSVVSTDAGYSVELSSPSASPNQYNTVTMTFDKKGAPTGNSSHFISAPAQPIFTTVDSSTIIDYGAEAVVDHLADSADLVVVANTTKIVHYDPTAQGILISVTLTDGRIFSIEMDQKANVVSKGFK